MTAYRYTIPEASFVIYPGNGWWELSINGNKWDEYASAEAAAYDVSAQNTGYSAWDSLEDVEVPQALEDWEAFSFHPHKKILR